MNNLRKRGRPISKESRQSRHVTLSNIEVIYITELGKGSLSKGIKFIYDFYMRQKLSGGYDD